MQLGIPIGGGVKYSLSKHWTLGLEFSYRQLFTDYLDDVSSVYADRSIIEDGENGDIAVQLADRSTEVDIIPIGEEGKQRGDSKRKDAFLFSGISLSYSIQHYKCPPPGNSSSKSKKLLRW